MELTKEYLEAILNYNPETGEFSWKYRPNVQGFKNGMVGKAAGYLRKDGYLSLKISGKKYQSHRLAYFFTYGVWPELIDHINGIRTDNRIVNLRSVTIWENAKNCKINKLNTSGILGVKYVKETNKWQSTIRVEGKSIHLGRFNTKEEAGEVRKQANIKYGYHENHGQR